MVKTTKKVTEPAHYTELWEYVIKTQKEVWNIERRIWKLEDRWSNRRDPLPWLVGIVVLTTGALCFLSGMFVSCS